MSTKPGSERPLAAAVIIPLSELPSGEEGTFFALLSALETLSTRDGKPYWRMTLRDGRCTITQPVWNDSPLADACRNHWKPGMFFKVQALLRAHPQYGNQLEIRRIREVEPKDADDGFDPHMCLPRSTQDPAAMFSELMTILADHVSQISLRKTIFDLFTSQREPLLSHPAAVHHHHAWIGGLLEHTLEVVRSSLYLAKRYVEKYRDLPSLNIGIVVAGAMVHDIGKLGELNMSGGEIAFTPEGGLLGHLVIGVRMLREAAMRNELDAETMLRLEHIILSHQRLPEWGSPKPPMTPEALIIHYADDLDAKLDIMNSIFRESAQQLVDRPLTSKRNLLQYQLFRSGTAATAEPETEKPDELT